MPLPSVPQLWCDCSILTTCYLRTYANNWAWTCVEIKHENCGRVLPNGAVRSPSDKQQIREQVFAAFIEFPPDDAESQDETIPGDSENLTTP